jgi:hypothetical protein
MSMNTKRFMVLAFVLLSCFILFAAGDAEAAITEKVDKIKDIAQKVGFTLCAIGFIAGGVMKAMGNQRANQLLIGSAIGAFVVAMATSLVEFFA